MSPLLPALAALALGALAWRGPDGAWEPPPVPGIAAAAGLAAPPLLPAALPGPWTELLARPPFEPSRRMPEPPQAEEQAVPEEEPPPPSAAAGIVAGPAGQVALLRLADGRLARAAAGTELDGWRVMRIGATEVELRRGERVVTLRARISVLHE